MGSSAEPNHSISSGISIPQWMKNRINDRYDIDETFSPPAHDDAFFYIRYPKSASTRAPEPVVQITEPIVQPHAQDFSQHTLPCRQFLQQSTSMTTEGNGSNFVRPAVPRLKPQGADDEIVGEGGACGKSVVEVAKQMMSNKSFLRSFDRSGSNENLLVPGSGFDPTRRRGSKSLPASPLGSPAQSPGSSPRIQRRAAHPNKFFTGTYIVHEEGKVTGEEVRSGYLGGWIWSGLLGNRDVVAGISPAVPVEEDDEQQDEAVKASDAQVGNAGNIRNETRIASASLLNSYGQNSDSGFSASGLSSLDKVTLQPKPSELREMNFWSPTSM